MALLPIVGNIQTERAQVVTAEFDELFGVVDKVNETSTEQEPEPMDEETGPIPDGTASSDI